MADASDRLPGAAITAPASLEGFLAGIGPRAFRFAEASLRHRDDALDSVQDAMTRMLGYRDRSPEEWTPLFWSVLRHRIVDAQRRHALRLRWLLPAQTADDIDWNHVPQDQAHTDPARQQHGRETWARISRALRDLPARQREAFVLRVFEELDEATTARVMGCGTGAVKTHLSRARESLRRQLEDLR